MDLYTSQKGTKIGTGNMATHLRAAKRCEGVSMRDVLMCKLPPRLPEVTLKDALETLATQAMCDVAAVASPASSSPPTQQPPANVLKTAPSLNLVSLEI